MAPHLEMLTVAVAASILARSYTDYSLGHVSTAVVLFVVQFLLYQAYSIFIWPHFVSCHRHLPQPPNNHWFWGQTNRILAEPSGVPMQDWVRNVPNTGLIRYSVWFQQRLLVTSPAALADVLVTKNYDFVKPWHIRTGLGRILGLGILVAEGEEHKVQRKNLSPAFSFRHVKDIYPIFWRKSREMVDCVAAAAASPPTEAAAAAKHISDTDHVDVQKAAQSHVNGAVDVGNWTSRATLDIIGLSGMGRDFDSLHDPDNELTRTYRTVFNPGRAGRILQVAGIFVPFWIMKRLPIKRNRELDDASAYIKQVCRDAIGKKRENMAGGKSHDVDILSVALQSGAFTDEDLVNQMMTFLVAGHETTATAMIWAIYLMCKHPDVQQKLRNAVRAAIPSLSTAIQPSDIDDCHYLQAVCTEVLRLWSPVSLTLRVADRDTSIQNEFVPKGTPVILSPWAVNCSPQLWGADAQEFKPERWINASDGKANQRGSADSNYSFLTFLHGPRSCIGQRFAQSEFACLLAAWVGRYETEFEEGSPLAKGELEIKGGVTSKPKGGLWCTLKEVPGW